MAFIEPMDPNKPNIIHILWVQLICLNTLTPRQDGRHSVDDIFKCIFLNENVRIPIKFSLKFVLKVPIDNKPALVQIMASRLTGDKPLSEPMVAYFTNACHVSLGLNELRTCNAANLVATWGTTFPGKGNLIIFGSSYAPQFWPHFSGLWTA